VRAIKNKDKPDQSRRQTMNGYVPLPFLTTFL